MLLLLVVLCHSDLHSVHLRIYPKHVIVIFKLQVFLFSSKYQFVMRNAEDKLRTIETLPYKCWEIIERDRERERAFILFAINVARFKHLTDNYTDNWTRLALNASKYHHSNWKIINYRTMIVVCRNVLMCCSKQVAHDFWLNFKCDMLNDLHELTNNCDSERWSFIWFMPRMSWNTKSFWIFI